MDCDSERIWKMVEKYTPREKAQRRPDSLNLFDNLYNCYIDNCQTCQDKRFRSGVSLLQKLPPELASVSILVNLYGDEDGYSIMLTPNDQKEIFMSYEDNEIFSYLDTGEIPPIVLEMIENTNYCHFYNGCLVCEVRNYRLHHCQDNSEMEMPFESTFILLKPSQEVILRYVNEVCSSRPYSLQERLAVESKLLLATQSPLCLEPEIDVVCVQNRLYYNKRKYHSQAYKRYLRKQSQAKRAIVHLLSEEKGPMSLQLNLFLNEQRKNRDKKPTLVSVKRRKGIAKLTCELKELAQEVSKYSKSYQSDVHMLIQQRNEVINTGPQPQTSTSIETTPTKKPQTTDEAPQPKRTISPDKPNRPNLPTLPISGGLIRPNPPTSPISGGLSKPNLPTSPISGGLIRPNRPTSPISGGLSRPNPPTSPISGGLFVSFPRSLAQSALAKSSKKFTEQKPTPKPHPQKTRPIRPHIPGKTTITVLSTSMGGPRPPQGVSNVPPKLHNPNVTLKTSLPSQQSGGTMPRLKPLEARTLPPPMTTSKVPPPTRPMNKPPLLAPPRVAKQPVSMAMNKPPPLAPPPITKPPLKSSPPSAMPQLHKIQSTSSDKPS